MISGSGISDGADYGSGNARKRPVWNKPSNGAGAGTAAAVAGPLMGAHRGGSSMKSCLGSLKGFAGSSSSTPPLVQVSNNRNPNSTTTPNYHTAPTCPIFTRSNAAGTSSNGFVSQSLGVNDHSKHHNSYMNCNGGTHHHRGRFMRHPPPPPPPPTPPIGYLGAANLYYVAPPPPDALRGVPAVAYFHATCQLHFLTVKQIDYYFSKENLVKDTYLRQKMDHQGWVPIKLIAGFNKVKLLTGGNIGLILDALRSSVVVEVQGGDKIRRRNDWTRWIMAPTGQVSVQ
ncbi:hypothetical protein Ddye_006256 [Dipteronia dyeriana]|uniref:HTH La-type RNA-binding domain-containing protein n=1 Tax=Dipteronia dyeriana TaxID=168575 RepID=A0AAD9XIP8_9ROSI|nr:hypothetical protein Ddye_006256 [Dipteronia dyeriana]